jgi:hypothetical protein
MRHKYCLFSSIWWGTYYGVGMLRHRPQESNVVVSLLQNKKGRETHPRTEKSQNLLLLKHRHHFCSLFWKDEKILFISFYSRTIPESRKRKRSASTSKDNKGCRKEKENLGSRSNNPSRKVVTVKYLSEDGIGEEKYVLKEDEGKHFTRGIRWADPLRRTNRWNALRLEGPTYTYLA